MAEEKPNTTQPVPEVKQSPDVPLGVPGKVIYKGGGNRFSNKLPRPLRNLTRKRRLLIMVAVIIVTAAAAYWYFVMRVTVSFEDTDSRTTIYSDNTAIMNGQKLIYDPKNMQSQPAPESNGSSVESDRNKIKSDIETKIVAGTVTVEERLELAQIYEAEKNVNAALEAYRQARKAITEDSEDAVWNIKYIEGAIKRLENPRTEQ